jgi:hypothetical protein
LLARRAPWSMLQHDRHGYQGTGSAVTVLERALTG